MGLFKRKTVISVSSVACNLAGDNQENYLTKTITTSVMNSRNISESLNDSYLNGMGTKMKQAYWYGRDHYYFGLPSSTIMYGTPKQVEVMAILKSLHAGFSITPVMSDFGPPDLAYWIDQYLTETYGYDADYGGMGNPPAGVPNSAPVTWTIDSSGEVTIQMGDAPTYLFTETLSFPEVISRSMYYMTVYRYTTPGTPVTDVVSRPYEEGDKEGTTTTVAPVNNYGEVSVTTTTTTVEIDDLLTTTTVTTTVQTDVVSRKQYFLYEAGTGEYPVLDTILEESVEDSAYYPVVPLRVHNVDQTDPTNVPDEQFKTSKSLLRKLGLSFTDLGDKINENPDVAEIDHAFFVMGISLNSQHESSIEYLYEFFKYMALVSPSSKETYTAWYEDHVNVTYASVPNTAPYIPSNRVRLRQGDYNITVAFQYSELVVVNGSIGPVGTVTREMGVARPITVVNEFNKSVEISTDTAVLLFRKQITETTYEEVEVCGLEHINEIYKGRTYTTTAADSLNDLENQGFIIPLCVNIAESLDIITRTQMTYDCMFIVINSYHEQKVKWYQSSLFKLVMIAIAIVTAVYGGIAFVNGLNAAMASATAAGTSVAWAAASYIATQIAIGAALTYGISVLARYIAPNLLFIAAAMMMVYGLTSNFISSGASSVNGLPYAAELMAAVPAVTKGTNMALQKSLEKSMEEMEELTATYEQTMDELKEKMDKLNANPNISIEDMINTTAMNLFETTEQFFGRTLQMNPGVTTLDSIQNYVDYALTLPDDLRPMRT